MSWTTPTYLRADRPITSIDEDRLQRSALAQQLAERVVRYDGDRALVVGLAGRWGAGKTSFLKLFIDAVKAERGLREGGEVLPPVVFTPWSLGSRDEIARDLLAELGRAVGDRAGARTLAAELAPRLLALAASAELAHATATTTTTPLAWLIAGVAGAPVVGPLLTPATDRIKRRLAPESMQQQFEAISKRLRDRKALLVVVLDDLERLPVDQIQGVFRVVGAIANFSNTVYVLSMDRHRVARALAKEYGNGHRFLEKFLHLTFDLPDADPVLLAEMFVTDLNRVLDARGIEVSDQRWSGLWHGGLQGLLDSPRDVVRILNAFDMALEAVPKDTDPLDLLGLEALRVCEPTAHRLIASHPLATLRRYREMLDRMRSDEKKTAEAGEGEFAAIMGRVSPRRRKRVQWMLGEIFPATRRGSGVDEAAAHRGHRAASPDHFDHYFRWSLAAGAFSERDMFAAVEALLNAQTDEQVQSWVTSLYPRFQRFGGKLIHYMSDLRDREARFAVAAGLLRAAHVLDDSSKLIRSDHDLARELAYHLVRDDSGDWAEKVWSAAGDTGLLYGLAAEYSLAMSDKARREGYLSVPGEVVTNEIAAALGRRTQAGEYDSYPHLGHLLFRWRDLARDAAPVQAFVASRVDARDPLIWRLVASTFNVRLDDDMLSSFGAGANREMAALLFDPVGLRSFLADAERPPGSEALVATLERAIASAP